MKSAAKQLQADEKEWQLGLEAIQKLDFCGCGEPSEAYKALLESLKAHVGIENRRTWAENRGGNYTHEGSGYDYLILYFLAGAGLTEHGGSVGGCWPSVEGTAVIKFLEDWGTDPDCWPEAEDLS